VTADQLGLQIKPLTYYTPRTQNPDQKATVTPITKTSFGTPDGGTTQQYPPYHYASRNHNLKTVKINLLTCTETPCNIRINCNNYSDNRLQYLLIGVLPRNYPSDYQIWTSLRPQCHGTNPGELRLSGRTSGKLRLSGRTSGKLRPEIVMTLRARFLALTACSGL
jgi:hypothetical protein